MTASYSAMPSSLGCRLLACSRTAISASVLDLATYVDVTGFEAVLVVLISAKLGAEAIVPETGTNVVMTALHSDASSGSGAVNLSDRSGANYSVGIGGSAAAGRACSMQLRTRGMKQFFSPGLQTTGNTVTVCCAIYGIGSRDTAEATAHWADEAGTSVANTAFS